MADQKIVILGLYSTREAVDSADEPVRVGGVSKQ